MEGVPRISMMSFPMRKSADSPNFKQKLKLFIRDHYNEDGESYSNEINELESLRAGAIHISKDFSGCSTLKKYLCQLNFLKSRFPLQEGGLCAVSFSWYDVYSETVHGWSDVDFEMSCILYNIGALHSELGLADNRQTPEGMKNACTHFQCAAWAFQHLRHNYQKFFTPDVSPDTLSIMNNICLAQAQECILEKSLIDNRKSTITAKVALQIVEYYQLALKTIDQMLKDSSQYSDKVVKAVKKWRKIVELKVHYYDCLSLLHRGMQAEDDNKWGERVTFYKAAVEKLTEAIKSAKSLEKTDNTQDTLQFTFDVAQGKVAISEKENEFVYHEKVPELNAIASEIKGVSLVKGIPFKFDDPQIAGPDIFGRLVPMEAHEASSLYSEEKAKVLRNYSSKIEEKNEALDKLLIALQLDQLNLHSSNTKVPQELVDCCAALSVNKDAVKKLSELMSRLSGMYHDVDGNLHEIQQLLKEDELKEKEYQGIIGKRAPSNVITELSREVHKYQSAHTVAAETNQTLHETLSKHVANLNILMKPFEEVFTHIPSLEGDMDDEAISQMKRLIAKVEEMRKQRVMLEQQLRDSIHGDDITKQLVIKKGQDLETVFQDELQKHDKITQILDQNMLAQENIMRALTEANANYAETRKATVELVKKRDKFIEELLNSYETYDELLAKCNKGIDFYTKLDANVGKLLQRMRSVSKVQEEERETSLKSLMKNPPALPVNNSANMTMGGYVPPDLSIPSSAASSGAPKLKDYLAMRKGAKGYDATFNLDSNCPPAPQNCQDYSQPFPQPTQPYCSNQNNASGQLRQPIQIFDRTEQSYGTHPPNDKTEVPSVRPAPIGSEDFSKTNANAACGYGNYLQQPFGGQTTAAPGYGQFQHQPANNSSQYNTNYSSYPVASAPVRNPPVEMNQNQYAEQYPAPKLQQNYSNNVNGGNIDMSRQQINESYHPQTYNSSQTPPPQPSSVNYPPQPQPLPQQYAYQPAYNPSSDQTNTSYSYPAHSSRFTSSGVAVSTGMLTSQSPLGLQSGSSNSIGQGATVASSGMYHETQQQYYSQHIPTSAFPKASSVLSSTSYQSGPSPTVPVAQSAAYQPSRDTTTATIYTTGTTPSLDGQNPNPPQNSEYVYESFLAKYVKQNQGYTPSSGSAGLNNSGYGSSQTGNYSQSQQQQNYNMQHTPYGYGQPSSQPYNSQRSESYGQSGAAPIDANQSLNPQGYGVYNTVTNVQQSHPSQPPAANPSIGITNNNQYKYPQQSQQYISSQPDGSAGYYNYSQQQQPQGQGYPQVQATSNTSYSNTGDVQQHQPKMSSNIDLLTGIDLNTSTVAPMVTNRQETSIPPEHTSTNSEGYQNQGTPPTNFSY